MTNKMERLRTAHALLAFFHFAQGLVILLVQNGLQIPITTIKMDGPPGSDLPAHTTVGRVHIGATVVTFLWLAAGQHTIVATVFWQRYERDAYARGMLRWAEYSMSATAMIVAIAVLSGITDLSAILLVVVCNVAMIGCGALGEEQPKSVGLFTLGSFVGLGPWIAIFVSAAMSEPPAFVWGIIISLLILFSSFGVNQALHNWGRYKDPFTVEWVYIFESLVSKSALAWQVAGATLV